MTKEIAEELAGLGRRDLVGIVSRWNTMPIKENISTIPKSFVARLSESLDAVTPGAFLKLERFARDCGVTVTVCRGVGNNLHVSLKRESGKYQGIIGDFQIGTADEFDTCARRILTDYLMQPEQVLAVPGGSLR